MSVRATVERKREKNYLSIIFGALNLAQKAIENSAAFGIKDGIFTHLTHTYTQHTN